MVGTAANAAPAPPFNQCPAVAASPSCGILIYVDPSGSTSVIDDPAVGPFDGIEDTLVGLQNDSPNTVLSLRLSSTTDIVGFDNDGLCDVVGGPAGCPFGPTGYEGPNTSLSPTSAFDGVVTFIGGVKPGGSAYFSLEERVTSGSVTVARPPIARLTATPTTGEAPLTVTFNGSQSSDPNPGGSIVSWTLDFGDGNTLAGTGTPPAAQPHTYATPGTFTATLSVTNADGASASASQTIVVSKAATKLAVDPALLQVSGLKVFLKAGATLTRASNGAPIPGKTIAFTAGGKPVCSAVTNAQGYASCTGVQQLLQITLSLGYAGSFTGDATYRPSSGQGPLIRL